MDKITELTGLPSGLIIAIAALLIITLLISLIKKVVGLVLTGVIVLIGVYLVFGYTPSQTIDTVKEKTAHITEKFEQKEFLNSLDRLAVKVNEEGEKILESESFAVYYDENGKEVVEDLKNKTTIFVDDLTSDESTKKLEAMLESLKTE